MSGLSPKDMDLAETSAPFSYANLMMLEEMGFCPRGEGGRFVADGGIAFEGGLPFNTIGGYLSFGQVAQGLYNLKELVDQLHGRAEGKPVPGAAAGIVHMHGGPLACHSVVILTKERLT
jgi:acetyl-CoA acetyltransferase